MSDKNPSLHPIKSAVRQEVIPPVSSHIKPLPISAQDAFEALRKTSNAASMAIRNEVQQKMLGGAQPGAEAQAYLNPVQFGILPAGQQIPAPKIDGERPKVIEVTAKIQMTRAVAQKLFPSLIFQPGEEHAVVTEILVPATAGQPIALVHGASGQKFMVDHYEFEGVRI